MNRILAAIERWHRRRTIRWNATHHYPSAAVTTRKRETP